MATLKEPEDLSSLIDTTTVVSLLSTVAILAAAYTSSLHLLPTTAPTKTRILFIWHAFDALIHFLLEGTFLYNCFFSYAPSLTTPSAYLPPGIHFLARPDRLYGSAYGTNPPAALWREYAKADARWGGTDLTVISLELLTVGLAAPLAVYICTCLARERMHTAWFWMMVVATGELYGGFMTFAPEWLAGNPNLDGSNWLYLWVYLVFFNMLWVWFPGWVLWEGYGYLAGLAATVEGRKRR